MDHLVVSDAAGVELAALDAYEPVAENPVISLDLRNRGAVHLDGHDSQGNRFAADVQP
jgi:sulfur-oxidizing protein SoxY